jgi:hypothetical protein
MLRARTVLTIAALIAAAPLAGCRVGAYAYTGIGVGPVDDPPSVNLAASPSTASPGETIGLVAAASDDYRVVEVEFYRLDVGGRTLLGRDGSAPYALDTVMPAGARGEVRYLARAVDDAGQTGDSPPVSVTVR